MSYPYLIETQRLTRDFASVRALDNLDLSVDPGIVFGFLGPNGAGKTTTIRLLLGLLEPSSGNARVLGFDTRSQSAQIRERAGALLEHTGLYERLSAEDNLDFYARVYRMPADARKARIRELLEHVGLWERRSEPLSAWSRGMKQKVAVARAMLHRPQLLFLDEPTAGLDAVAAAALREDLALLVQIEKVTVFLTTHNLAEAERLCSQVAIVNHGKLLAVGSPDELRAMQQGEQREVYGRNFSPALIESLKLRAEVTGVQRSNGHLVIELHPGADFSPLVSLMTSQGAQIDEIRKQKASLEEVFLNLVEDSNGEIGEDHA